MNTKTPFFLLMCLVLSIAVGSCATSSGGSGKNTGRAVNPAVPQFVKDAIQKAPEDAVLGVGVARMSTLSQSRTMATTRARADISRTMNTITQDMVRDYQASSEVDHSASIAFQENITVALSRSQLVGASIVEEDMDNNGNYWCVMIMGKTNAVNEINQSIAAAKLRVPAMMSFDAEERMNKAFDNYYNSVQGFNDRDN